MSHKSSHWIEQLLLKDHSEKRKAGRGVMCRASRTGRVRSMRTPLDLLSKEERRKYKRPSPVSVYYLNDSMASFDEFDKMDTIQQRSYLNKWRARCSDAYIYRDWGLTVVAFYCILEALDLPRKRNSSKQRR
ncbi:hypothetical protein [Heliophilum fasciatum]|uniref:Uncharacterized protein n=1 Tax=Heliophilum fasciatum TaxID=35700 RepID=A0A4R2RYS3_9FIRM|nr:hypothetical protein [Heliophilum fasciatum]MCW2277548.1 hypothetical protein [Heliophilum fasciatum]TCP65161.1 hypothetical protein EDD73_10644 [Heliophilum fasciatum]